MALLLTFTGENPAAMQHGSHSTSCVPCPPLWVLSFLLSLTLQILYLHSVSEHHVHHYHQSSLVNYKATRREEARASRSSSRRASLLSSSLLTGESNSRAIKGMSCHHDCGYNLKSESHSSPSSKNELSIPLR